MTYFTISANYCLLYDTVCLSMWWSSNNNKNNPHYTDTGGTTLDMLLSINKQSIIYLYIKRINLNCRKKSIKGVYNLHIKLHFISSNIFHPVTSYYKDTNKWLTSSNHKMKEVLNPHKQKIFLLKYNDILGVQLIKRDS